MENKTVIKEILLLLSGLSYENICEIMDKVKIICAEASNKSKIDDSIINEVYSSASSTTGPDNV